MTKREFLTAVTSIEGLPTELMEYAQTEIEKLDATNAKRRESDKPTKASLEAAAARERIIYFVMHAEEAMDAETIAEGAGVSKGQVPSALRTLIDGHKVEKSVLKVDSKHRKTVYKYVGE